MQVGLASTARCKGFSTAPFKAEQSARASDLKHMKHNLRETLALNSVRSHPS